MGLGILSVLVPAAGCDAPLQALEEKPFATQHQALHHPLQGPGGPILFRLPEGAVDRRVWAVYQ